MAIVVRLSCQFLLALLVAGLYCRGAPTQDLVTTNFITGLVVSKEYSRMMVGEPSTETGPRAVVDTFCDLLTYHEMMKVIADNSSGNGTSTDALPNVKTLVLQNLKDTCHWITQQISLDVLNVSDPTLFNEESCSMNDTTTFREECVRRRISAVTSEAFRTARRAAGTVHFSDQCQWIRRLGSSSDSIIQHYGINCSPNQ